VKILSLTKISSMAASISSPSQQSESISIAPLLQRLAYPAAAGIRVSAQDLPPVSAKEIASAFALIFEDRLSHIQTAALLTLLHSTGKDRQPDVIAKCSECMRDAACQVEKAPLIKIMKSRNLKAGNYEGGLVCITTSILLLSHIDKPWCIVWYCWNRRRFSFDL
jgi:Glycosyl transferase family, helical bundle domain.